MLEYLVLSSVTYAWRSRKVRSHLVVNICVKVSQLVPLFKCYCTVTLYFDYFFKKLVCVNITFLNLHNYKNIKDIKLFWPPYSNPQIHKEIRMVL